MLKILVVDDHPIVRQGIKQCIQEKDDMVITGEASNGEEALRKIGTEEFDLIILDISMPGKNGIDIIKNIKATSPELPVLVLSMHQEQEIIIGALKAGANGYLIKDSAPNELIEAIYKVSEGKKYLSSDIMNYIIIDVLKDKKKLPHESLTPREYQIMSMLASGKSITIIAHELALSVKTISTHRANIMIKMNLQNNVELTRYAITNNLIHW